MGCTNPAIYIGYLDDDPDSIMFLCEEHKDSADEVELLESEVAEN